MIKSLLGEYPDIFIDELQSGLPPKRTIDHAIETGTARPTNKNPYPLSSQQLREQAKQVDDLLKRGLIQESVSPWGASVLFVAKKTPGEWRMCIDYRALNTITFRNTYPLPRIQECIDRLGTATHLSSLDLTSVCNDTNPWKLASMKSSHGLRRNRSTQQDHWIHAAIPFR